jgi:hypothetical protein
MLVVSPGMTEKINRLIVVEDLSGSAFGKLLVIYLVIVPSLEGATNRDAIIFNLRYVERDVGMSVMGLIT